MRMKLVAYLSLLLYTSALGGLSIALDFDLWLTTLLLVALPTTLLFLWMKPPVSLFLMVGVSSVATTILFESVAYSSGLWYELSSFDVRVFNIFPIEMLGWNFALQLFIVAVYEYFSDDRKINLTRLNWQNIWLLGFVLMLSVIGVIFSTSLDRYVLPMALWWLLIGTMVSLGGAMVLSHRQSWLVLKKAALTALCLFPFLFIQEAVSVFNFHWVFANPSQYLYSLTLFNEIFPIERLVLLLVMPMWLVVVYESYLDDGR